MSELKLETHRRLRDWRSALVKALEETGVENERRRIELELLALDLDVERLNEAELAVVHERLGRDPSTWLSKRA